MKKNDLFGIRVKDKDSIFKIAAKKRQELNILAAKMPTKGDKNLKKLKNLKKELSQVLTLLREREIIDEEKGKTGMDKNETKGVQ